MVIDNYLSFGPQTLPDQVSSLGSYLGEVPRKAALACYENNKEQMQANAVYQQFFVESMEVTKQTNPFVVRVKGVKTIISQGKKKPLVKTYLVEVSKIQHTKENPFGLVVINIVCQEDNQEK